MFVWAFKTANEAVVATIMPNDNNPTAIFDFWFMALMFLFVNLWGTKPLSILPLSNIRIPMLEDNRAELEATGHVGLIGRAEEQVHGRQVTMVSTLIGLGRGEPIRDYESMLVSVALREMYEASDIDWANRYVLRLSWHQPS